MSQSAAVELHRVSKSFGDVAAVRDVSLTVRGGEFFSLLGPSGCGKTTLLRLLAGLEEPNADGGEVRLLGEVANGRRPYQRRIGMVFQSYALFPHLTVGGNVAFGLEQRGGLRVDIRARVGQALELVRLDPATFADRMPGQLSGGQRQRVALARALVLEPAILLLDEPLGAIDLKLRKAMQLELKTLNRQLGTTFIYVTHDQEEALTMSDRIAVMRSGRVAQVGTPAEIYENPRTPFVATFIGEANVLTGRGREGPDGWCEIVLDSGDVVRTRTRRSAGAQAVRLAVRPEAMDLFSAEAVPSAYNALAGTVVDVIYLGDMIHVAVTAAGGARVVAAVRNEGQLATPLSWRAGDAVVVGWRPASCRVLAEDE